MPKITPSFFSSMPSLETTLGANPEALEGFTHVVIACQVYSITSQQPGVIPATTTDLRALFQQYPPRYSSANLFTAGEEITARRIRALLRPQAATAISTQPPAPPSRSSSIAYMQRMRHAQHIQEMQRLLVQQQKESSATPAIPDGMIRVRDQRVGDVDSPAATHVSLVQDGRSRPGMIHANFVRHPTDGRQIILTQYPTPQVNSQFNFWSMICQRSSDLILDVSSSAERSELGQPYYPTFTGDTRQFNYLLVTRISDTANGLQRYRIHNQATDKSYIVHRYHHSNWSEGFPIPARVLERLANLVINSNSAVIHGQIGVGRSAVVAAASTLMSCYHKGLINFGNIERMIQRVIRQMRQERGPYALRHPSQTRQLREFCDYLLTMQGIPF